VNFRFHPLRLFVEVLLVVACAELAAHHMLPLLVSVPDSWAAKGVELVLVLLLAAPGVYLRCVSAYKRGRGPTAGRQQAQLKSRTVVLMTVCTQVFGLVLTGAGLMWEKSILDQEKRLKFEHGAERIHNEVIRRFNLPLYGLRGARGVYAAKSTLTAAEFRDYVESRNLPEEFPGVQGISFIERIKPGEVQPFENTLRAAGLTDFKVRTSGANPNLYVVKYIEPLGPNWAAWGYDLGQDPARLEVVERAVQTGEPALTGSLTLVQDAQKASGFIYFLPIYRKGADPTNAAQREQTLVGLVSAPMITAQMLDGVLAATDDRLTFELFDSPNPREADRIFHTALSEPSADERTQTSSGPSSSYTADRALRIGGRDMTLRVATTPRFDVAEGSNSLLMVGIGGVFLSLLMSLAVWLLAIGRVRAQALAMKMTEDLDRLARVVQHTSNAVLIADADMRIQWVNEGFTTVTGYSMEEARGKRPVDLLAEGDTDRKAMADLAAAARDKIPFRTELHTYSKAGQERWIETELQPTFNIQGQLTDLIVIGTDITEQKRAQFELQAAIRETEAIFAAVEMHAIVSVADAKGKILGANDAFCQISGYTRAELIGQDHRIINSGVHSPEFWESMWATISEGHPWRGDICNRSKDGSLYWVDSMIAPFKGEDGRVERFVSIRTDITARRLDQLKIAEMTDRMNLAIEGGNDGLWDWQGLDQPEQWWAPNYYRLLGYTPAEMPSTTVSYAKLLHPDDVERHREAKRWAIDHLKDVDLEVRLLTKQQGYRWFRVRAKVFRDANAKAVRLSGSTQDIHERKMAEAEVRHAEQILRASIEALNDAFVLFDNEDRLVLCNQRYRDYYPESAEVLNPGTRFEDIIRYGVQHGQYESAIGREEEWVAERMALHRLENSQTMQLLKNGRTLRVMEHRTPEGYTVGLRVDVSDFVQATQAAQSASDAKSRFLANMSHEIRTPMNAILGMLSLLQKTPLSSQQADYAGKASGAAKSLLGLLNDILDLSKVEAGKMTLDPQPFRLDTLMRDLSSILSAYMGNKPVEVLFDLDTALPEVVVGDAQRLSQVLINLAGNAVKFTAQGNVVVSIRVQHQSDDMAELVFAVRDTGIGIDPAHQHHIFTGFTQAEASTTRKFGGTGLGLAISQKLVQAMGSDIELTSALGEGSTFAFTVTLPVVQDIPEALKRPKVPSMTHRRALVVDDNPTSGDLMVRMIRAWDWPTDLASSGAEALALIEDTVRQGKPPYDVMYVDERMPDMDGWETVRRLRELCAAEDCDLPVTVMVSTHGRIALDERAEEEAAMLSAFLVKPVTGSMLQEAAYSGQAAKPKMRQGVRPVHRKRRLTGLRLLVVEDNLINQQVAEELLTSEGAYVAMAANGQLGVDAVAAASPQFDAVLMDIQMPIMDGYTATRTIREQLGLIDLPIIAMTANAMASDREECLAAGMTEHVGKPFDLPHLVNLLLRLTEAPIEGFSASAPPEP